VLELTGKFRGGQRYQLRPPANRLRKGFVHIAASRKRGYLIALGELLNNGKGALADGAGGTENRKSLQFTVYALENLVNKLSVPQRRSRQQQCIDTVQHTAMPR